MLRRQYGAATPSSLVPVAHAEDAQPNEGIYKRSYNLPPTIRNSSAREQATSIHYRGSRGRGGYRGSNMNQGGRGGQRIQYATRGNSAWRGRGRGVPGYSSWTPKVAEDCAASSSASSNSEGTPRLTPRIETMEAESSSCSARRIPDLMDLHSSQTSATPPPVQESHVPRNWMVRSRSPTPKLPATPLKRRKVEDILPLPSSSQMPPPAAVPRLPLPGRVRRPVEPVKREPVSPSIKREVISPSPPPPPRPERKLITESCKFFPFPDNCRKSDPNYQQNRRSFFLEKNREIMRMGLKREKAFARDDGLVIEWSSPVPVWSDTLQPEIMDLASAILQTVQTNHKISSKHSTSMISQGPPNAIGPSPSRSNNHGPPPSSKTIRKGGESQITPSSTLNVQPGLKKRTASTLGSASAVDAKRSRRSPSPITKNLNPPPHTTLSQTNSQSDSKKRLPLPGRKSLNTKSITVPVAFSPRRSTTPTSIPAPTLMPLMKQNEAAGRRSSLSNSYSHNFSTLLTQTSPPNEISANHSTTNQALDPDGLTLSMRKDEEDNHLTTLHVSEKNKTASISTKPDYAAPGTQNKQTPNTDDTLMVDSDSRDAEDVATSLLKPTLPNPPAEEDGEVDGSTDDGSSEIEGLVSDYLLRYCRLFDSDRSELEMAYDENALFSCRVHHQEEPSFSMAGLFAPEVKNSFRSLHSRASASTVDQGRTHISNRLLSMGPYQFCPRGVTGQLSYDAVDSVAGVLLTVHGEVVNPHISNPELDHVLTLDQSFVLRQTNVNVQEEEKDTSVNGHQRETQAPWPLVAISHQMTVRAAPLLSAERLEEHLPWIRDISS